MGNASSKGGRHAAVVPETNDSAIERIIDDHPVDVKSAELNPTIAVSQANSIPSQDEHTQHQKSSLKSGKRNLASEFNHPEKVKNSSDKKNKTAENKQNSGPKLNLHTSEPRKDSSGNKFHNNLQQNIKPDFPDTHGKRRKRSSNESAEKPDKEKSLWRNPTPKTSHVKIPDESDSLSPFFVKRGRRSLPLSNKPPIHSKLNSITAIISSVESLPSSENEPEKPKLNLSSEIKPNLKPNSQEKTGEFRKRVSSEYGKKKFNPRSKKKHSDGEHMVSLPLSSEAPTNNENLDYGLKTKSHLRLSKSLDNIFNQLPPEEEKDEPNKNDLWEFTHPHDLKPSRSAPNLLISSLSNKNNIIYYDMLGFKSKLFNRNHGMFTMKKDITNLEEPNFFKTSSGDSLSNGPDMTWVREFSSSNKPESPNTSESLAIQEMQYKQNAFISSDAKRKLRSMFALFLWLSLITGRMPFKFHTKDMSKTLECKLDWKRHIIFILTSIFLILVTLISIASYVEIHTVVESKNSTHGLYLQTERLLLGKQWTVALLFIFTFVGASIFSLSIIFNGKSKAEYITEWFAAIDQLGYDATFELKFIWITYVIAWIVQCVVVFILYSKDVKNGEIKNAFMEATDLISTILFRYFIKKPLLSDYLHYYEGISLLIFMYGLLCSTAVITLTLMFSTAARNVINEWNLQLALLFKRVTPKSNEPTLTTLSHELEYNQMFLQHNKIIELVDGLSATFSVVLLTYYLTKIIVITSGLFDVALFLLRNETRVFEDVEVDLVRFKYDKKDTFSRIQSLGMVIIPSIGFFITSLKLSDVAEAITQGFDCARRQSLLFVNGTHEKRFIISLLMKSSGISSYSIHAYGLFNINRAFIFSFFAFSMAVFSVLIQFNIPRLANVPILIECDSGLCIAHAEVSNNKENIIGITQMSNIAAAAAAFHNKTKEKNDTTGDKEKTDYSYPIPPKPQFPCEGMNVTNFTIPYDQLYKCAGTEIIRFHTYTSNAIQNIPSNKTFHCLFNPYPTRNSKDSYYDCFGNNITEYDECGNLNFGIKDMKNVSSFPKRITLNYSFNGFNNILKKTFICFNFSTFYKSKMYTHVTLEGKEEYQCGLPKSFSNQLCMNISSKKRNMNVYTNESITSTKFQELIRKSFTEYDYDKKIVNELCTKEDVNLSKPRNVSYLGHKFLIESPVELHSIFNETVRRHTLRTNGSLTDIFERNRFTMAHPDLVNQTTLLFYCANVNTNYALIPHVFDDCGGLGVYINGIIPEMNTLTFKENGTTIKYKCYQSNIPDYICGVPFELTYDICTGWNTYLNETKPIY